MISSAPSPRLSFLLGSTGRGDDAIAELVEESDCDRAHSTSSPGHQHVAFCRERSPPFLAPARKAWVNPALPIAMAWAVEILSGSLLCRICGEAILIVHR